MQFSELWLRSMANPPLDTGALSHLLTMSGLEVEEVNPAAAGFSGILVGEVLETSRHPNADRLNVCQVRVGVGADDVRTIVCGASNVRPGIRVPCALPGAVLPPGASGEPFLIKVGQLRGVESQGMLCSARELRLPDDIDGLLELPSDAPVGTDIRDYLQLNDVTYTIKLTPNRADCLSVLGVAREVAALTQTAWHTPPFIPVTASSDEKLPVKIEAPDLCGRFAGRILRGLNAKAATPLWMKQRLERSGQRSLSALVDISNYVMLELGQPTHVFDLDKVQGGLTVRWGKTGETLKLLNGNTVSVDNTVGVIADEQGIESLAGIMGGDTTSVTLETRNVFVESAFWFPDAIRGRARRFNFSTDAGHRYERGVDFNANVAALERITALIIEICGTADTVAGPVVDQIAGLPSRKPVRMRLSRARRLIGVPFSAAQVGDVFTRLGFTWNALPAAEEGDALFEVAPPSFRFDMEIEEDLVEEIARVYGFDQIPAVMPRATYSMQLAPENQRSLFEIRHRMVDLDFNEVINYSFVSEQAERRVSPDSELIRLRNPIASQMSVMRSSLLPGLLENLQYNINRKTPRIRVFELGATFARDASVADGGLTVAGFSQPQKLAAAAYGPAEPEQWGLPSRGVDYFDLKADLEALAHPRQLTYTRSAHPLLHPGRSADVSCQGKLIGTIGELHPKVQQDMQLPRNAVLFEIDLEALRQTDVPVYQVLSRMPVVTRDLALVVGQDVSAQSLLDVMWQEKAANVAGHCLQAIVLFDEYRGKGLPENKKSLAFRITLQDTKTTLQDDVIDQIMASMTARVQSQMQAEIRS